MRWKIYYTDSTTFSSDEGGPLDAPCKGVAVIIQEDGRCGRRILKFMDWYRWDSTYGRWFECEAFDVLRTIDRTGTVIARRGEYMSEAAFEKLAITAYDDKFIEAVSPDTPAHPVWRR